MEEQGEIILYQPDEEIRLEVRLEDETVWLTQAQMANLFDVKENTITYHIKEIYSSQELDQIPTTRKIRVVRKEGKREINRLIDFYNLDVIISVGYRVSSKNATLFRRWATTVLKDYLLKGYSINQRINQLENKIDSKLTIHDRQLEELTNKVDFFVRTSLPPIEGVFFDGQIFDSYVFATNLVKSAKKSLILIDNYVDESVLLMLAKRSSGVTASIYTAKVTSQLQLDLRRHNSQYPIIEIHAYKHAHDRFIIIDDQVYHIGASLKDLGKKLFAFSKLNINPDIILKEL